MRIRLPPVARGLVIAAMVAALVLIWLDGRTARTKAERTIEHVSSVTP